VLIVVLHSLTPRQSIEIRPGMLVGSATHLPNLLELVQVRISGKDRMSQEHLPEYTAENKRQLTVRYGGWIVIIPNPPDVNFPTVISCPEE
jgi:hypothetical protein